MKRNLNYILYLIALIVIIIPIMIKETTGMTIGQPAELCLLSIGVICLIAGKLLLIRRKRQKSGESIVMDTIVVIGLIVMLVWMLMHEL